MNYSGGDLGRELIFSFSKKDFRVDTYRGEGAGGQHRNTTDSAVRITHIESGLSANSCDGRSQHQNKATAFKKLVGQLVEQYVKPVNRGEVSNTVIRTYNEVGDRVVDMETKRRYSYKETIGRKNMTELIEHRNQFKLLN